MFLRGEQVMSARYGARALTESLEAQYFAPNRTDEFFASSISRAAEQTTQNCCWSLGRDCCCHVTFSTPEMCRSRMEHHPQNIPFSLIGVISLNTQRHQTLADALILIRILWAQGFGEGVPQLLEDDDELLGLNVVLMCFPADSLQKISKLRRWTIRSLELIRECHPQLVHRAF